MKAIQVVILLCLIPFIFADVYLHAPRGSNNRNNEQSTNRDNNNRMCDTQNNAKGGYANGPKMYYYVGSRLPVEWTNQHGCGGNSNVHCQLILQYLCGDDVRDGVTTDTPPLDATRDTQEPNPDPDLFSDGYNPPTTVYKYGKHESYDYYTNCQTRLRNGGLFLADQNPGPRAIHTRQNPGGGRSGYECSEERDYYPYWHPSPWIDIAVLTDNTDTCTYYAQNTENSNGRNYCANQIANNQADCIAQNSSWEFSLPNGGSFDCQPAPYSRDNHLGNGYTSTGYSGSAQPNSYMWTIPNTPSENCILRLRYNVSSGDYDGWNTFSDKNGANSSIKNDPYIDWAGDGSGNLSLAINTAQFGRTFQDRSYTFAIRTRPSGVLDTTKIYNLNVRGKRGNIVQVYPAVEYDFVPNLLNIRQGSLIHFQWTGSDKNPQGNDGEGTAGTDKSNLVLYSNKATNIPNGLSYGNDFLTEGDRYFFATLGQSSCLTLTQLQQKTGNNNGAIETDPNNCMKLNNASLYFDGGLHSFSTAWRTWNYMSTRNNNFTNRSQKGAIIVTPFLPVWAIVLVCFAGLMCLISIFFVVVGAIARYGERTFLGQKLHGLPRVLREPLIGN